MEEKQLGSEPMFHTASKSHEQVSLIKHSPFFLMCKRVLLRYKGVCLCLVLIMCQRQSAVHSAVPVPYHQMT